MNRSFFSPPFLSFSFRFYSFLFICFAFFSHLCDEAWPISLLFVSLSRLSRVAVRRKRASRAKVISSRCRSIGHLVNAHGKRIRVRVFRYCSATANGRCASSAGHRSAIVCLARRARRGGRRASTDKTPRASPPTASILARFAYANLTKHRRQYSHISLSVKMSLRQKFYRYEKRGDGTKKEKKTRFSRKRGSIFLSRRGICARA